MPSTKIINVSRDDSFEDIFNLFRETPAEEVIFIFPKGSQLARSEANFKAIKDESNTSGKEVSIMTSDPVVAELALNHGIGLLESSPSRRSESSRQVKVKSDENIDDDWNTVAKSDDEVEADLIVSRRRFQMGQSAPAGGRPLVDVVPEHRERHRLRVKESEDQFNIDVRNAATDENDDDRTEDEDIVKVWQRKGGRVAKRPTNLRLGSIGRVFGSRKTVSILIASIVLIVGAVLYSTLASAKIIIRPQKQELNFQLKVTVSTQAASVNPEFNRVPGQLFSAQKEKAETFPVSGEKEVAQKAGGKITIFNKSASTQKLVATTRFESPEGLIFRVPQTITVPAASAGASVLSTPGSIESIVYADRPGPEYNIGPTKFTIPGLKGTAKFDQFYAASIDPMIGGVVGLAKVVTEADFTRALETLTKKVKNEVTQSLKKQSGELKILDSTNIEVSEPVANAKIGEAAESLKMSVRGSARTVAFRESDILELVRDYVAENGDLEVVEKSLSINYSDSTLDSTAKNMSFTLEARGRAAAKVNPDKVIRDIAGMNEDSIRNYFRSLKEVESARVILSPFWVKKIPRDHDKVKIEVVVD